MKLLALFEDLEISAKAKGNAGVCLWCKDTITTKKWTCPKCKAGYHLECVHHKGRCQNSGCSGRLRPMSYGVNPAVASQVASAIESGSSETEIRNKFGDAAYYDALRGMST